MAEITASLVKELREKTGAGMMDCKKALAETGGDLEKAVDFLRTKGLADAAKKSSRVAAEGLVVTYMSDDLKNGAIVEINCETDFVAKTDDFIKFSNDICKLIADKKPADMDALMALDYEGLSVEKTIAEKVAKIGENIKIRRFAQYDAAGRLEAYIHAGGKIGVLVEFDNVCDTDKEVIRDVALHICAANPLCISDKDLDPAVIEHEKAIYIQKAKESGKPDNIIEKIVEGQVNKFKQESCLISQKFVKNPDESIAKLLGDKKVIRFTRYQLGEGIEKKKEDRKLVFVGDGINDAPVLTRADIGISMGAIGSDAAIEASDIVLMDDNPAKIPLAIEIAKKTLRIVKQNIVFALSVKMLVLITGALGITNMWAAVFADVGVSVIAILNAIRALKFDNKK